MVLGISLSLVSLSVSAQNVFFSGKRGDASAGKAKLDAERCLECHDQTGKDMSQGAINKFATLSGQYAYYIVKQLIDFRTGKRKYDFMKMMASNLDDQDLVDIAAYFASQKKMQGDGSGDSELASKLFQHGDADRHIVACANCHGTSGQGQISAKLIYPAIGGQQWSYLQQQLQDWRSGERRNSPDDVMTVATKLLTDAEVSALSQYISGLR